MASGVVGVIAMTHDSVMELAGEILLWPLIKATELKRPRYVKLPLVILAFPACLVSAYIAGPVMVFAFLLGVWEMSGGGES